MGSFALNVPLSRSSHDCVCCSSVRVVKSLLFLVRLLFLLRCFLIGTSFSEEILTRLCIHSCIRLPDLIAFFFRGGETDFVWPWRSVRHEPSVCTAFRPFSTPSTSWSLSLRRWGCLQQLRDKDIKQKIQYFCGSWGCSYLHHMESQNGIQRHKWLKLRQS